MRCLGSRRKLADDVVIDPDGPRSAVCPECGRRVRVDAYRYLLNHDRKEAAR
jgi:hypothetical protein